MKNSTVHTTSFGARLLNSILWELSLLGHKTIDVVKVLLQPGSRFRRLPHVRILLVLSMLVLIFNDNVSFSVGFGEKSDDGISTDINPNAANAGVFDAPIAMFSSLFSSVATPANRSSAFAKTELTLINSQTGTALIDRFKGTALAEQKKYGIDAGVLLATAIAAGTVQTPEQVTDLEFTTNFFGTAQQELYPTAWSSWRAMSLSVLASTDNGDPTRDDFVLAAAQQFTDTDAAKARIYEALRFYEL